MKNKLISAFIMIGVIASAIALIIHSFQQVKKEQTAEQKRNDSLAKAREAKKLKRLENLELDNDVKENQSTENQEQHGQES